jgi:hypothetical protein
MHRTAAYTSMCVLLSATNKRRYPLDLLWYSRSKQLPSCQPPVSQLANPASPRPAVCHCSLPQASSLPTQHVPAQQSVNPATHQLRSPVCQLSSLPPQPSRAQYSHQQAGTSAAVCLLQFLFVTPSAAHHLSAHYLVIHTFVRISVGTNAVCPYRLRPV